MEENLENSASFTNNNEDELTEFRREFYERWKVVEGLNLSEITSFELESTFQVLDQLKKNLDKSREELVVLKKEKNDPQRKSLKQKKIITSKVDLYERYIKTVGLFFDQKRTREGWLQTCDKILGIAKNMRLELQKYLNEAEDVGSQEDSTNDPNTVLQEKNVSKQKDEGMKEKEKLPITENVFIPSKKRVKLSASIQFSVGHPNSSKAMIFTHPYPILGGNMNNPVVVGLFSYFAAHGYTVVRFNFRGVGRSTGSSSWRGNSEKVDVQSVCEYLFQLSNESFKSIPKEDIPSIEKILIVGYSYGAGIACATVNDFDKIVGYVAISYPFGVYSLLYFGNGNLLNLAKSSKKQKLFIMGTEDSFTSLNKFEHKFNEISDPKQKEIVPGASHFWSGKEEQLKLARLIDNWIEKSQVFSNPSLSANSTKEEEQEEEEEEEGSTDPRKKSTSGSSSNNTAQRSPEQKITRESQIVFSRFNNDK